MKYSIIIPIYNSEKTLDYCLQSLENQTFSDFEVLMINDGSSDRSEEICLAYVRKDPRFSYHPKENGGVSSARNLGMDLAAGEYVTFLDADDQYFPSYLTSFEKMLQLYPGCGHYWCAYRQYIDTAHATGDLSVFDEPDHMDLGETIAFSRQEEYSLLSRDCIMDLHARAQDGSPCNKLYRTDLLKGIRMKKGLSLGEDMLFNWEYLDANPNTKIVVNNSPQYWYYISGNQSLDHKYRSDHLQIVQLLMNTMSEALKKWKVSDEQWKLYYDSSFFRYEKVFRNTMRSENTATRREKIAFNNSIIRSDSFQTVYKYKKCRIHPLYAFAYTMKNYRINLLCDGLIALKKRFIHKR